MTYYDVICPLNKVADNISSALVQRFIFVWPHHCPGWLQRPSMFNDLFVCGLKVAIGVTDPKCIYPAAAAAATTTTTTTTTTAAAAADTTTTTATTTMTTTINLNSII